MHLLVRTKKGGGGRKIKVIRFSERRRAIGFKSVVARNAPNWAVRENTAKTAEIFAHLQVICGGGKAARADERTTVWWGGRGGGGGAHCPFYRGSRDANKGRGSHHKTCFKSRLFKSFLFFRELLAFFCSPIGPLFNFEIKICSPDRHSRSRLFGYIKGFRYQVCVKKRLNGYIRFDFEISIKTRNNGKLSQANAKGCNLYFRSNFLS